MMGCENKPKERGGGGERGETWEGDKCDGREKQRNGGRSVRREWKCER